MSHFSVMVRVPAETAGNIEGAVGDLLEPFNENEHHEFVDETENYRKEWETESVEMVRCEDGSLVFPWDRRFRDANDPFGLSNATPPAHLERVQVPHRERYRTFEMFCRNWHHAEENNGRFGYMRNPRGYWDYWRIGGRWRGDLLVKRSPTAGLTKVAWEHEFEQRERGTAIPGSEVEVDFAGRRWSRRFSTRSSPSSASMASPSPSRRSCICARCFQPYTTSFNGGFVEAVHTCPTISTVQWTPTIVVRPLALPLNAIVATWRKP